MLRKDPFVMTAAILLAAAGASAQPRIISLGDNAVGNGVTNNGAAVVGSASGTAIRWSVSGATVTGLPLPGATGATGVSNDGLYITGVVANTGGVGGFPADAQLTARWHQSSGWSPIAFMSPNPSVGVSGPGMSGGEISSPRDISATGRFIVGQGYIAPDEVYQFRGFAWDSQTGASLALPTSFNPENNRFRDGRALAISADGSVIVGGEDPHSSGGRLMVWRWNASTSSYTGSYLPDGLDAENNPITRSVDNFYINSGGTVIVGTSYEYDAKLGFPVGPYLAKWTWDAGSSTWSRQLIDDQLTTLPSWWIPPSWCDLPHTLIPTGMSDDGNTIVGIVMYSLCGSFQRGGFIWTAADNQIQDFYDHLVEAGTPGILSYGPEEAGLPPRLGWPNDVSADGLSMTGYGGPFSGFGPGWVVNMNGGACVSPFVTANPENLLVSRCSTFIMNAAAGGSGALSFQWHKDGQPIFDGPTVGGSTVYGSLTSRLYIESANLGDLGNYHCVITGACGTPVSTTVASATIDPNIPAATNDVCTSAAQVGEGTFTLNPCGAFVDDATGTGCAFTSNADVWFRYTPTFTGNVRLETCSANYDTVLSVYDQCAGIELACNDDRSEGPINSCSFYGSRVASLPVTAGVPVLIRVANLGFLYDFSAADLSIAEAPPAAVNDNCASPSVAVVGANPFSTDEATGDGFSSCSFAIAARDVWFSFSAASAGELTLTTCDGNTFWDTNLAIFDSCNGAELACNDNTDVDPCWSQSTISGFSMAAGQTVLIRVAANYDGDGGGSGVLSVRFDSECVADFNLDGSVNSQDFFDFLTAFFADQPNADVNRDGVVNSQDFFDFLTVFFEGC